MELGSVLPTRQSAYPVFRGSRCHR